PSRLKPSTSSITAAPGKIATHGASSMYLRPVPSIVPQDGSGGWMPRPRKESVASARIAVESASVVCTIRGAMTFGSTCSDSTRVAPPPAARAASTYSRPTTARTGPRVPAREEARGPGGARPQPREPHHRPGPEDDQARAQRQCGQHRQHPGHTQVNRSNSTTPPGAEIPPGAGYGDRATDEHDGA